MTINLNANPYFDDFSEDKSFHQILFRPGYSVQARELTQLQSILRDQIAKFGGHVFKHGSVVIPGNSSADLNVCYVKLTDASTVTGLVGSFIVNTTTGLRGLIKAGINADGTDPATIYVSYTNTGLSGGVTTHTFTAGDTITLQDTSTSFTVSSDVDAVGGASMATITKGIFFVNGTFVTVPSQSAVIGKYTSTPSCHVLLQIVESTVDSDIDSTLLDPAQGSYNYAAPGADRLKIDLVLTTLPLETALSDDYVEIMRYNVGILEEHLQYSKYNELEKNLARRTYEESGDYLVSGLNVTAREHLHTDLNGGRYAAPTGDATKMIYTVGAGKAYIRGFETEVFSDRELVVDKARDSSHVKKTSANLVPSFGQYLYLGNVIGLPDFTNRETVTIYNQAVSGGTSIGSAKALAVDFHESNTSDANVLLKLFVSDLALTGGLDVNTIGRITWSGGSADVLHKYSIQTTNTIDFAYGDVFSDGGTPRTATTYKFNRTAAEIYAFRETSANSIPQIGDNISHSGGGAGRMVSIETLGKNTNNNLLLPLPRTAIKTITTGGAAVLLDGSNTDITYKTYHSGTVDTSTGVGSLSVSGMTIDPIEQGNLILSCSTGLLPSSWGSLSSGGLTLTITVPVPSRPIASIQVVCAATKVAALRKTKTLTRVTETGIGGSTIASGATVQLAHSDGVRLISVTAPSGDVTKSFVFSNGQDDFAYYCSSLKLISGVTLTGPITVTYDYFTHHAAAGDYFSVDSYTDSGLADYYTNPMLNYTSKNTGRVFDLRNCLDFRPSVGTNNTFTGTGAVLNELVQNDSRLTTSLQSYIGRIDAVILAKDGTASVITGVPSDTPRLAPIPKEVLYLANIPVDPYTYSADNLKPQKQNNRGYTMRDVGKIEDRVAGLEDYVTLNQSESNVINYDVVDAKTGLSRYKSGYLVDTFTNPDAVSDVYNPLFKAAYVSESIVPSFEVIDAPLTLTSNLGQVTGNVITLPYTHTVMARQPISSKFTNINPFSVFSWHGSMMISPSTDTWVEIENLNAIVNNIEEVLETTSVVETTEIVNKTEYVTVHRPWTDLAPAPATPVIPVPVPAPAPVVADSGGWFFGMGRSKIICTAMNDMYGLPYRENRIWIRYAMTHLKPEHQVGYHRVFLPLVDYAFKQGDGITHLWLRDILIWIAVTRTQDIQAELKGLNPRPFIRWLVRKPSEMALYYIGKWFSKK